MEENTSGIKREYELARKEGRQPNCIYCGKPLTIIQTQYVDLTWKWSKEERRYKKFESGEAEKPYCADCGIHDWDFVDEDLVSY